MTDKKRILILTSEFPPLPGGIGNHAYNLAKSLTEQNRNFIVVTDQRSPKLSDDLVFDKGLAYSVIRIPRYKLGVFTYSVRVFQVIRLLLLRKVETVIASGKFSLWLGAFCSLLFPKRKYAAVLHGSEIFVGNKMIQNLTAWSISRFDKLIAVSHFTRSLALQQNKELQITVINNGFSVPDSEFTANHIAIKGSPTIVTVGNVTARKGQQNVINTLPLLQLKYPNIHYHIIGLPTEKQIFGQLAHSLNVSDSVSFHGVLPDSDLKEILRQSTVFFMLSDHLKNGDVEGFGIAVLEANALGIPAIGSINSGIADAIKDGYSGRLVNPHNAQEVSLALDDIMGNYDLYKQQAKDWSVQFDWSKIIQKYLEVLEV